MHEIFVKSIGYSMIWIVALGGTMIYSMFHRGDPTVPRWAYVAFMGCLAVCIIGLIIWGLHRAAQYVPSRLSSVAGKAWYEDPRLLALVLFWAFAPPSYFFVEYYAFDEGVISCERWKDGTCMSKADCLAEVKTYADIASKFWAAASAVLAAFIAMAKRPPSQISPASSRDPAADLLGPPG